MCNVVFLPEVRVWAQRYMHRTLERNVTSSGPQEGPLERQRVILLTVFSAATFPFWLLT